MLRSLSRETTYKIALPFITVIMLLDLNRRGVGWKGWVAGVCVCECVVCVCVSVLCVCVCVFGERGSHENISYRL